MDATSDGYIATYIYIPSDPVTSQLQIYYRVTNYGGWYSTWLGHQLDYYEGTLRIYCENNNRLYGQVAKGSSTSFLGNYTNSWMNNGTHWYWSLSASRDGSQVLIEEFEIKQGNNYFYTETPKIESVNMQNLLSVPDVSPRSYKNIYLRTQIPAGADLGSSYETNLKAMWRTPVY